jgi:hypothetical protein
MEATREGVPTATALSCRMPVQAACVRKPAFSGTAYMPALGNRASVRGLATETSSRYPTEDHAYPTVTAWVIAASHCTVATNR